jgi:hypothetical protein
MDWIEKTIGISPDGGSGTFEVLILVVVVSAAFAIFRAGDSFRRTRNRNRNRNRNRHND